MNRLPGLLIIAVLPIAACTGVVGGATQRSASPTAPRLAVALPSEVHDKARLVAGVKCDHPPFGYTDESGNVVGYEIDMVRHMAWYAFGDAGAVGLQCVASANRVSLLTAGKVDMIVAGMTYTAERAKTVGFSDPYLAASGRLLVARDSTIKQARDLAGKTVATLSGGVYATYLQKCVPQAQLLHVAATADALMALRQGRAQAFLQDDTLLVDIARNNPDLKVVGPGVDAGAWGVAVRPADPALKDWVDAALAQMRMEDFNWKSLQRWILDPAIREEFGKAVPRPRQSLTYNTGAPATCPASPQGG